MTRVIYLHGFASGPASRKARFFRDLLTPRGFDVEIPDLAEGRFAELTITGQLDVVARACGDGPVVLIGSSLGGYLAALYAARRSEVKRVVLLAPAFSFATHWAETLGDERMKNGRRLAGYRYFTMPRTPSATSAGSSWSTPGNMRKPRISASPG
jgi:pimeloyl-ACP methyl ester carboxylesterase